ncbi:MAG: iron-sulfur cluster repair di-iron protein, ric [Firmicutes bacterium]|nr:iron-sulfur cluster repair di-iron protein, ric [Bacillota bacterium]
MTLFDQVKEAHLDKLKLFVPVVDRVHGNSHPEFHDVRKIFEVIDDKIKAAGVDQPDLSSEFARLREITDHYTVPNDVCESYAAVYNMLKELDAAHQG